MRRSKTLFGVLVTLALVLSMAMAVPVYAADVGLTNGVTPITPNEYQLGDTIHYVMSINNWGSQEDIVVQVVRDVLPDGSTVYPTGPTLPYTLHPGQSQGYTYDWVANETGTVINTFYASGYQISTFNDTFSESVEKSSLVMSREEGSGLLVNKLRLVAPWLGLLACAAAVTLLVLRKRRHA